MRIHFDFVTPDERKEFLAVLEELTGEKAVYHRVPQCNYTIGGFLFEKRNILIWEDKELTYIVDALEARGYKGTGYKGIAKRTDKNNGKVNLLVDAKTAPPKVPLEVSLPRKKFTDSEIENLEHIIAAKAELFKRAFACENIEIVIDDEKITFPWFMQGTRREAQAYIEFVSALGKMASTQKRVSSKPREIENEKYEFRCFLLRLGFIGDKYKATRKVLLSNLSGCSAWKAGRACDELPE